MARDENTLPDENALLCEACGYILTGLPSDSRCPECGQPISDSSPQLRHLPDWERDDPTQTQSQRFWSTTFAVILHPTHFYRTLATRGDRSRSKRFARIHWIIATVLFSLAGSFQLSWMLGVVGGYGNYVASMRQTLLVIAPLGFIACGLFCYATLIAATHLAARLTAWEARFRNFRLPHDVVLRGLDYHSPHYLPVALLTFLTVAGYQLLLFTGTLDALSGPRYLYILCAEVFIFAVYLFKTYWAGMRNMLYANR